MHAARHCVTIITPHMPPTPDNLPSWVCVTISQFRQAVIYTSFLIPEPAAPRAAAAKAAPRTAYTPE